MELCLSDKNFCIFDYVLGCVNIGVALSLTAILGIIGNMLTCVVLRRISLDNVFNQVIFKILFEKLRWYVDGHYCLKIYLNKLVLIYKYSININAQTHLFDITPTQIWSLLSPSPLSIHVLRPYALLNILYEKDLIGSLGLLSTWRFGQYLFFLCKTSHTQCLSLLH